MAMELTNIYTSGMLLVIFDVVGTMSIYNIRFSDFRNKLLEEIICDRETRKE